MACRILFVINAILIGYFFLIMSDMVYNGAIYQSYLKPLETDF